MIDIFNNSLDLDDGYSQSSQYPDLRVFRYDGGYTGYLLLMPQAIEEAETIDELWEKVKKAKRVCLKYAVDMRQN